MTELPHLVHFSLGAMAPVFIAIGVGYAAEFAFIAIIKFLGRP